MPETQYRDIIPHSKSNGIRFLFLVEFSHKDIYDD